MPLREALAHGAARGDRRREDDLRPASGGCPARGDAVKVGLTGFSGSREDDGVLRLTGLRPDPADRRAQIGHHQGARSAGRLPRRRLLAEEDDVRRGHVRRLPAGARCAEACRARPGDGGGAARRRRARRGRARLPRSHGRGGDAARGHRRRSTASSCSPTWRRSRSGWSGVARRRARSASWRCSAGSRSISRPGSRCGRSISRPRSGRELAGFAFLSLRPLLVVLNVPESDVAAPLPGRGPQRVRAPPAATRWRSRRRSRRRSRSSTPADRAAFLADLGLARERARSLHPRELRAARPDQLPHRGRGRVPRVADPPRHGCAQGGGPHPQRHRARLHPRRGDRLRRLRPASERGEVPRSRQAPPRGQGLRRPGRRHRPLPVRCMIK